MPLKKPALGPRVVVALDNLSVADLLALVDRFDPSLCRLKIGKELFCAQGPAIVQNLVARGFDVFLDLKFHDIPNTVAQAVKAAAALGVWMVNVHASGGSRMMRAAAEALQGLSGSRPLLTAVTVLTSMDDSDLREIGVEVSAQQQVERLACLAKNCGLDGVVIAVTSGEWQHRAKLLRRAVIISLLADPSRRPLIRQRR
jgi:orotidine-5'-phosphate decarboxylase